MRPDNTSQNEIIAMRRNLVARLRLTGLSQREVWEALAYGDKKRGGVGRFINPQTDAPFSLGTINGDIKAMEAEWRKNAAQDTDTHQARQLAEIQKIKLQAFTEKNPALALRAIDLEMKLLGTAAPTKIDFGVSVDKLLVFLDSVRKLGHDPEKFIDRTNERAQQLVQ